MDQRIVAVLRLLRYLLVLAEECYLARIGALFEWPEQTLAHAEAFLSAGVDNEAGGHTIAATILQRNLRMPVLAITLQFGHPAVHVPGTACHGSLQHHQIEA